MFYSIPLKKSDTCKEKGLGTEHEVLPSTVKQLEVSNCDKDESYSDEKYDRCIYVS